MTYDIDRGGGHLVHISGPYVRGVWKTDIGQRVEQWVPRGTYEVCGALSCGPSEKRSVMYDVANGRQWTVHYNAFNVE